MLEMRALRKFLEATPAIRRCVLLPHIDNLSVVWALRKWSSRTPRIHAELALVHDLCSRRGIEIDWCSWIPTAENVEADALSRASDPAEYRWSTAVPRLAAATWPSLGPLSTWTDAFGSATAHQGGMRAYHSRFPDPAAEVIDTLLSPWPTTGVTFLTPPLSQIGQVLAKASAESSVTSVLVHPVWTAALWWPRLLELALDSRPLPDAARHVLRVPNNPARPEASRGAGWRWQISLLGSRSR
jgi:hypothetical protein